jgi:hypothetical protein
MENTIFSNEEMEKLREIERKLDIVFRELMDIQKSLEDDDLKKRKEELKEQQRRLEREKEDWAIDKAYMYRRYEEKENWYREGNY